MDNLDTQRRKIDKIDKKLLKLLDERFKTVLSIKKAKKRLKASVTDKKREKEVFSKCKTAYQKAIFIKIISESKRQQNHKNPANRQQNTL